MAVEVGRSSELAFRILLVNRTEQVPSPLFHRLEIGSG